MPSSLTVNLSSASVFSTRPPVSVSGTGRPQLRRPARVFSGACSAAIVTPRMRFVYCRASPRTFPPCGLAKPFNALFRQRACASLLRHRWDSLKTGCGILTACPSAMPYPGGVRSRLTLNRLALFRNPWSFGDGVSRPICRYLYLHLLFRLLQRVSRHAFAGAGMLPYRLIMQLIPRLRHRTYARLLSTRGRLTGELLRTL